jgi:hypothetical protein
MSRNLTFQTLRGVFANMPALANGEFYLATDTGILYIGSSLGPLQVGPMASVQIQDATISTQKAAVDATGDIQVDVNNFPATVTVVQPTGTNLHVVNDTGSNTIGAVTGTAADNSADSSLKLPTLSVRANAATPAWTEGNQVPMSSDLLGNVRTRIYKPATYSAGVSGITTPADGSLVGPFFTIQGSASKTVTVKRIGFSDTASTGGAAFLTIRKYSALSGGVNGGTNTPLSYDTNAPAATAVVFNWTTIPTTVTAVGGKGRVLKYEVVTTAVTVLPQALEWLFGDDSNNGFVLRGASEWLGLSINVSATTPSAAAWVEWTEE